MLRAVIIDDEQKGINALKLLLEKHLPEIKVVAASTKPVEGLELIGNYKPEIVFLDINMPQLNGFELLQKLEWKEFNLVFTTAHREYGLRALKNNAIDYLLKPIDPIDLKLAVEKIKEHLLAKTSLFSKYNFSEVLEALNAKPKLILPVRTGVESIDISEIIYLESVSNYTTIYLSKLPSITSSKTLKEFELQLCKKNLSFMRVHQSYIVNLNKVLRYLKIVDQIVMVNDQRIPLAKSRKDEFFTWLEIE